jgi:hypothetical protein
MLSSRRGSQLGHPSKRSVGGMGERLCPRDCLDIAGRHIRCRYPPQQSGKRHETLPGEIARRLRIVGWGSRKIVD